MKIKNRSLACHMAVLLVCAFFLVHCPDSAAPIGPIVDEAVPIPKSLYLPMWVNGETQVYRVDIEPVEGVNASKSVGYRAKSQAAAHLKMPSGYTVTGLTPFNEIVASIMILDAVIDPYASMKTISTNTPDEIQVRLFAKDSTVDLLKNRKSYGYNSYYDDIGDRLLFLVYGDDHVTNRLMQRGLNGKESELYQDQKLYVLPGLNNVLYLFGSKGVFVLTMADGKITRLMDSAGLAGAMQVVGRKGDYLLFWKTDKNLLIKSDGSKSFDLPKSEYDVHVVFYSPDLNEFVFSSGAQPEPTSAKLTPAKHSPQAVYRLDLKSGHVTTLYSGVLDRIIDHIGEQYLVCRTSTTTVDGKQTFSTQFSWLKPDGTLQDIVNVPTNNPSYVMSYNPQNQAVLIGGGDKLLLVSMKEGKVVATLDNYTVAMTKIYPFAKLDWPVLVTTLKAGTPGSFNVGLISPDTLGGATGTELAPVSLGTIDTQNGNSFLMGNIITADIRSTKVRTPAAVADTTPAPLCVPVCKDKGIGSDGCGGTCGECAAGSSFNSATAQCMAPAPKIGGIEQGAELQVPADSKKTFGKISVKSDVGLTSVVAQCDKIKIYASPQFDPAAQGAYFFDMIIGPVSESGNCKIIAKDSVNQTSTLEFVVLPK